MPPPIDVLRLGDDLSLRLRHEARTAYPREACGFLFGRQAGGEAVALRVSSAENRATRPDRFFIDARDVFEAMRSARCEGSELLGVYHSHPEAAPVPSAVDRDEAWGDWLHLIVACRMRGRTGSTRADEMACWRWDGGGFVAVRLLQGTVTDPNARVGDVDGAVDVRQPGDGGETRR